MTISCGWCRTIKGQSFMIDKCEVGGRRCGHGCACLGELDCVLGLGHGLLRQPVLYGRHSHELILGVLDIYGRSRSGGVQLVSICPHIYALHTSKGKQRVEIQHSEAGSSWLQDCDLYILDFCGQVTVDDCKNCRIFVGPCEGRCVLVCMRLQRLLSVHKIEAGILHTCPCNACSLLHCRQAVLHHHANLGACCSSIACMLFCACSVFLRDCSNCSFAVVARQLRTRDIHDCNIALLCRTRPIVETSTNVRGASPCSKVAHA